MSHNTSSQGDQKVHVARVDRPSTDYQLVVRPRESVSGI